MAAVDAASTMQLQSGPPLVLASASPTRAQILRAAGIALLQQPAAIDEDEIKTALQAEGVSPLDAAVVLAELKAKRVAAALPEETLVLGADQILVLDETWFSKPVDRDSARRNLLCLSGRRHQLPTAVVAYRGRARVWHTCLTPSLTMRKLSPAFIESYLDRVGSEAFSSVGAYQLEGAGAQLFEAVEGDYFAILGLPLLPLLAFLRDQQVLLA